VTIIDGGIENVDPGLQAGLDGGDIALVGSIAGLAQIRSQSDGRKPKLTHSRHMLGAAKVIGIAEIWEAVAIARCSCCGGTSGKHAKSV